MNLFSNKYTNKIYNNKTIHKIFNNNCYSEKYLLYLSFKIKNMQFQILLSISIIITIVGFIASVEWYSNYILRPKSKEDKLIDDLINDKITVGDFVLEIQKQVQYERKKELNNIRKEKIKKLNNESR